MEKGKMPNVPTLKRALVLWATGNGSQSDMAAAQLARELCAEGCFFCGSENPLKQDGAWTELELCGCLPMEQEYLGWRNPGYREVLPNWQRRQEELVAKFKKGQLEAGRPVYSNTCVCCGESFAISVKVVAASVVRHGEHAVMNRCKRCADSSRKGVKPIKPRSVEEGAA